MKSVVVSEKLGEIVYAENFWTGKKTITVNGVTLKKINKKTFSDDQDKTYLISGSFVSGVTISCDGESAVLTKSIRWYEIAMGVLPLLFNLIWGNIGVLCKIIPVVGGAIGGAVNALISLLGILLIKQTDKWYLKVLIAVAMLAVGIGVSALIGIGIIAALT